jgi:chromosomal replication initiation ATPase DnaA
MISVLEKIILKMLGSEVKPSRLTHYDQRIQRVIKVTSEVTGVSVLDLLSKRRLNSNERHIAMYLSVRLLGCSYPEVGRAFGRDHSTVYYACRKLEKRGRGRSKTNRYLKEIEQCLSA